MSKLDTTQPADSPLWRIGLYRCANIDRLKVGDGENLVQMAQELDAQARDAGFEVIQSVPVKYSPGREHGYTHTIAIGQSSIVIHTYPEIGTATLSVETCGDYGYCEKAVKKLATSLHRFYRADERRFVSAPQLPLYLEPMFEEPSSGPNVPVAVS